MSGYGGDESTAPGTSIAEQLVLWSIVLLEWRTASRVGGASTRLLTIRPLRRRQVERTSALAKFEDAQEARRAEGDTVVYSLTSCGQTSYREGKFRLCRCGGTEESA